MAALFPITRHGLWDQYKRAVASFWTVEEIDLSKDLDDWRRLSESERHFIKMVLAFFAGSDGIVFENLNLNFAAETEWNEAKAFYSYQGFNEMIHAETYSLLIDKYADESEKAHLFNATATIPTVAHKAEWARKWFSRDLSFVQRLMAFACVEGIFFSGSFCAIFWLKRRGLMPGLCFSNELISRDEGTHLEFAVSMIRELGGAGPEAADIVREAVAIEKNFIIEALPCKLIGMDSVKMSEYIEYVGDRLLKSLGLAPVFGTMNPFDWMENISLEGKTNFFEKRVGDYSKHVGGEVSFDENF